jgi:hypothetical protein
MCITSVNEYLLDFGNKGKFVSDKADITAMELTLSTPFISKCYVNNLWQY